MPAPQPPQSAIGSFGQPRGQGEWTQVFRARPAGAHDGHTGSYAVKCSAPSRSDDPLAKEMLAREARVAAEVQTSSI